MLRIGKKEYAVTQKIGKQKAQIALLLIDKLIKKHRITLYDIDAVEVNTGPGSFTGLRVGTAVANALGFALGIPINGKKEFVDASY